MKHKGATNEYSQMRDDDLFDNYKKVLSTSRPISTLQAAGIAANLPAKRFYISEFRARNVVMRLSKGLHMGTKGNPMRMKMYKELLRRYIVEKKMHPKSSVMDCICRVVEQQAPCFYLSPHSAESIIYAMLKKKRNEGK